MPNTIACITGYPQDMCVAIATHGPQACTLSLCSVPAASRRRVLIKSCSTVQMLNDTHESAQQYTKTAQPVISGTLIMTCLVKQQHIMEAARVSRHAERGCRNEV